MSEKLEAVLEGQGARFGEDGGARMARAFGDPRAEYDAVRTGCGVAWRADRRLIEMEGRDPVRMLQGLITNDLSSASAEEAVYAAMLTPKGRVISDLRAVRGPEGEARVWLDVAEVAADPIREHLTKFVPPMFAKWAFSERVVLGVYGPEAEERLREVGVNPSALEEDEARWTTLGDAPAVLVGTRYTGTPGVDLWLTDEAAADIWTRLTTAGAVPVGHAALETLRVEAGRPRMGLEMTGDTIATEAFETTGQMERAISFSKGCYTGQEVIVRIAHRGRVNRHIRGLRLGDRPTPEGGAPLLHPEKEKEVGWVTTAVASPRLGETIALAYLRREHEPGSHVLLNGEPVEITNLPFPT